MEHSHSECRMALVSQHNDCFGTQRIPLSLGAVFDLDDPSRRLVVNPLLDPSWVQGKGPGQLLDGNRRRDFRHLSVQAQPISEMNHARGHCSLEFRKHEKGKQLQLVGVDRLMIRHFSPKFRSVGALTRIEMFEITQTGETECVSVAHFVRVESTD